MPRESNTEPSKRRKCMIVINRPYCSSDPEANASHAILHSEWTTQWQCHLAAAYADSFHLASSLHLWKMTSTNFKTCLNNLHNMMTLSPIHSLTHYHALLCMYYLTSSAGHTQLFQRMHEKSWRASYQKSRDLCHDRVRLRSQKVGLKL